MLIMPSQAKLGHSHTINGGGGGGGGKGEGKRVIKVPSWRLGRAQYQKDELCGYQNYQKNSG